MPLNVPEVCVSSCIARENKYEQIKKLFGTANMGGIIKHCG
jgi:hypothetical protein